jgi:hypothetical protein
LSPTQQPHMDRHTALNSVNNLSQARHATHQARPTNHAQGTPNHATSSTPATISAKDPSNAAQAPNPFPNQPSHQQAQSGHDVREPLLETLSRDYRSIYSILDHAHERDTSILAKSPLRIQPQVAGQRGSVPGHPVPSISGGFSRNQEQRGTQQGLGLLRYAVLNSQQPAGAQRPSNPRRVLPNPPRTREQPQPQRKQPPLEHSVSKPQAAAGERGPSIPRPPLPNYSRIPEQPKTPPRESPARSTLKLVQTRDGGWRWTVPRPRIELRNRPRQEPRRRRPAPIIRPGKYIGWYPILVLGH